MADKDYTIRGPDGREFTIRGPADAPPEQLRAAAERAFAALPREQSYPGQQSAPLPSHATQAERRSLQQSIGDTAAGAVQGAANIGSTLMIPIDEGARARGIENSFIGLPNRRGAVKATLANEFGADPGSLPFRGGELASEVAGTGGVGPALGRVATRAGLPLLAQALATGGFALRPVGQAAPAMGWAARVGEQGIRSVGGAIGGAAAAGLADPNAALAGGAIGAALPSALRGAGALGAGLASVVAGPFQSMERRVAPGIAAVLPDDPAAVNALLQHLRGGGQQFLPGSLPNAAEATGDNGLANLVRAVQAGGGRELFDQAEANAAVRMQTLAGLGGRGDNVAQVREDLGRELERRILPEDRRIGAQVSDMFQNVDVPPVGPMGPQQPAAIELPLGDMENALSQFLGPGVVGAGADARAAIGTAADLTRGPATTSTARVQNARGIYHTEEVTTPGQVGQQLVGWREMQDLRSSLGALARDLRRDPRTAREAAALEGMQAQIDARVADAAAGNLRPGEVFTPEMLARWTDARAASQARNERFRTGPQRELFERDESNLTRARGGEIPGLFWNATPGQVGDVQSYRTLVDDNPHMMDQLRGLALTEAGAGVNAGGDLTQRAYSNWLENRLPALREIMDPQQMATLQAIQADLDRAAATHSAGRVAGSNTAQLQAAMQGNGLLENPLLGAVAQRLPFGFGSTISGPTLLALRDAARRQRVAELAAVLSDPDRTARGLESFLAGQQPLGASASNALSLGYRAVPVLPGATD
jgi:hypothetical protein